MKLIIAGSRDLNLPIKTMFDFLNILLSGFNPEKIEEIVSGTARGIDSAGEKLAEEHHIPVKRFPAAWDKYGKAAGPIRNKEMAEYADTAVVFINNMSKGSLDMVRQMKKVNKPCIIIFFQDEKYITYRIEK